MKQRLTLEAADAARVARAALAAAAQAQRTVSVAVVDESGNAWLLERTDAAMPITALLALAKARTAALLQMPSEMLTRLLPGHFGVPTLPDMVQIGGGVPLAQDGVCVGAIGVSGADEEVDRAIAEAGAAALHEVQAG